MLLYLFVTHKHSIELFNKKLIDRVMCNATKTRLEIIEDFLFYTFIEIRDSMM
jgi:hypothetical protein